MEGSFRSESRSPKIGKLTHNGQLSYTLLGQGLIRARRQAGKSGSYQRSFAGGVALATFVDRDPFSSFGRGRGRL
jgi:hypothetical protein